MRKAFRNPHLFVVVFRQFNTHPLSKGRRAFTKIYRHIKNSTAHHPNQLTLGLFDLVMQTTQNTLGTAAVVVLHKIHIQTSHLVEVLLIKAFKKEASAVTKHLGFENEDIRNRCGGNGIGHYLIKLNRYWP